MYTVYDIYCRFRRSQGKSLNRAYRIPKDFEHHFQNKMKNEQQAALRTITDYFNTKWRDIDPNFYFDCGFTFFGKNFSYHKFFDRKLIKYYIQQDRKVKRDLQNVRDDINNSIFFVKNFIKSSNGNGPSVFLRYSKMKNGGMSVPVEHYIKNKIGKFFITWLIKSKMLKLTDDDISKVPYIMENYRKYVSLLEDIDPIKEEEEYKKKLLKDKEDDRELLYGTETEEEIKKGYKEKKLNEENAVILQ